MAKVVRRRKQEQQETRRTVNWILIGGVIVVGVIGLFALLFLSFQEPEVVVLDEWCSENPENCVSFGAADAPITIVEVYDYACPACGAFTSNAADQIAENYFDSEDVRWIYFPYSLPQFRDRSPASSLAALCMAEQGNELFHEFHNGLFAIQSSAVAHTRAGFDQVAEEIGADAAAFDECLEEGRYRDQVEDNLDAASLASVDATPSFYVNGQRYTNIGSFEQIQQIVDSLRQ